MAVASLAVRAPADGVRLRVADVGEATARAAIGVVIQQALDGHEDPGFDQRSRLLHLSGEATRQRADEITGIHPHGFDMIGDVEMSDLDGRSGGDDPGLMQDHQVDAELRVLAQRVRRQDRLRCLVIGDTPATCVRVEGHDVRDADDGGCADDPLEEAIRPRFVVAIVPSRRHRRQFPAVG